ncbi:MAG: hypothetical protein LBR79_01775 [Oscillospiraceae bacterium]|nr:hypothetical protein [Oscillospiraceae bacterium]
MKSLLFHTRISGGERLLSTNLGSRHKTVKIPSFSHANQRVERLLLTNSNHHPAA